MNTRWFKVYATLWWDEDHKHGYCPIEFNIHTRRKYYLIRPFARAQMFDWKHLAWTNDAVIWRHIVSSPENPEIWDILERQRTRLS